MKVTAIIYTVVMIISLALIEVLFSKKVVSGVDTLEINSTVISIENTLTNNNLEEIEETYHCDIVYFTDVKYDILMNSAIKEKKVIVDLKSDNTIVGKIIFDGVIDSFSKAKNDTIMKINAIVCLCGLFVYTMMIVIYYRYIKPFKKLESFASNIAKGELDIPLTREKGDYFGAFSEAFDEMREALKKAKEGENKANMSKKELIAGLSHDIKSPISTIRALCELMEIKITDEEIKEKILIIDNKAKLIDTLMNDMFASTLEELEAIKMNITEEQTLLILDLIKKLNYYKKIKIINEVPRFLVFMDKLRLYQVFDNIISNSYKYANTEIIVSFKETKDGVNIIFKDYGNSCKEEDLPLVTEKYFRGENAKGESGSGLGLYLVKEFMLKMKGDMECSIDGGFVVTLFLKKV